MSYANLPVGITLIRAVTEQTEGIALSFKKGDPNYESFNSIVKGSEFITTNANFLATPAHITNLQILMCLALSMYGGVMVPSIKQLTYANKEIRLTWDSGITDSFTFGIIDVKFKAFSKYFQTRLSSKASGNADIPNTIFRGVNQFLQSYMLILDACRNRIAPLLKGKTHLIQILEQPMNKDLLFIILSSMPADQMNSLFIFIQKYLPEDLSVKTPDGNRVNVCSLFETPSTDVTFLSEKNRIYLDLYFDGQYPIIKEITQSKTSEYMVKLLSNKEMFEVTMTNLQNIITLQVDTRVQLYQFFINYLDSITPDS
ncbi:hypothetical protein DID80_04740 [Candidatus Marinamargulisbacteria bacterium SCGC AAA071-K20]|nr:hypothetical protein DID80_04740 [Candidatus Marinamargulisbacteria bacterium SCGC AAA071-K20]